jgi:hypothetical protein
MPGMHVILVGTPTQLFDEVSQHFIDREVNVSRIEIGREKEDEPEHIWTLTDTSDKEIKEVLNQIVEKQGDVDGFLFLPYHAEKLFDKHFSRLPFFFAKHISRYFHRSVHPSRKAFVVVTSMDGSFGLGQGREWNPGDGALAGLVKTLHQEWPWVFTRIIDLLPELPADSLASTILSEWVDADSRQVEVGITLTGRYSIVFERIAQIDGDALR